MFLCNYKGLQGFPACKESKLPFVFLCWIQLWTIPDLKSEGASGSSSFHIHRSQRLRSLLFNLLLVCICIFFYFQKDTYKKNHTVSLLKNKLRSVKLIVEPHLHLTTIKIYNHVIYPSIKRILEKFWECNIWVLYGNDSPSVMFAHVVSWH